MTPTTAVNLRRLGLAIEAVCLLALLSLMKTPGETKMFLGVPLHQVLTGVLIVGMVLWLVGTVTYYRGRWAKKPPGET